MARSRTPTASPAPAATAASPAESPRSVKRILGLLELLARNPEGCSLAQLSVELESPKSSMLMLLRPFVTEGYLLRSESRYLLGPPMYRLAAQTLNTRRIPRQLRPFLIELAECTGETVYVAVLDERAKVATFVDTIASSKTIRFAMPIGYVRPLFATASGRLLLAYQDEAWREEYLAHVLIEALTPHTTTDIGMIRSELIAIREIGLAISIDEAIDGGGAIAAPIFGADGKVEAALTITAPTSRLRRQLSTFQQFIREIAHRASTPRPEIPFAR